MKKTLIIYFYLLLLFIFSCSKDIDIDTATNNTTPDNMFGVISSGVVVLKANTEYKLTGALIIKSGAKLVIESGVKVIAQSNLGTSNLYISVERGGRIEAIGTQTNPITFTASETSAGSWGGICIHGNAPNNTGENASSEVNGTQYGGNIVNDNSGTLQYCIIKYSGAKNGDKEFNGLSLFSVGSGTKIDHIAIFDGGDDAFEWYGGNVNCSYLFAQNNEDDNFDIDLGFVGTLSYLYSINSNANASSDSRAIESDNHPSNFLSTPFTFPTINNISIVGRGSEVSNQKEGVYFRRGIKANISNLFCKGFPVAIGVEHDKTIENLILGDLKITQALIEDVKTKTVGKKTDKTSTDVSSVLIEGNTDGAGNKASIPTWANWF